MIQINTEKAKQFLEDEEFQKSYRKAEESLTNIQNGTGEGAEWLGRSAC